MQLCLMDKVYEYTNELKSIKEIFHKIESEINESELHFSHLIINDVEVYSDFEEYIIDSIDDIKKIEVKVKTLKEFLNDLLLTTEDYLIGSINAVQLLIDELYSSPTNETWIKLEEFIEALQWLNNFTVTIDKGKQKPFNWDEFLRISAQMENEFSNLGEAIENRDPIHIADIIQYEYINLLKELKVQVTITLDQEGVRNDIN